MTIELTDAEFEMLLVALGYAAGGASQTNRALQLSFLRVANAVNRNNPRWTPYEVPEP